MTLSSISKGRITFTDIERTVITKWNCELILEQHEFLKILGHEILSYQEHFSISLINVHMRAYQQFYRCI